MIEMLQLVETNLTQAPENVLFAHPSISQASVVGISDERYGECVAAFVLPNHGVRIDGEIVDVPALDVAASTPLPASSSAASPPPPSPSPSPSPEQPSAPAQSPLTAPAKVNAKLPDRPDVLTATHLRDWVRQNLSNHFVPKYVFWVRDYPKTASGKIQKFRLREVGEVEVKAGRGV